MRGEINVAYEGTLWGDNEHKSETKDRRRGKREQVLHIKGAGSKTENLNWARKV